MLADRLIGKGLTFLQELLTAHQMAKKRKKIILPCLNSIVKLSIVLNAISYPIEKVELDECLNCWAFQHQTCLVEFQVLRDEFEVRRYNRISSKPFTFH